MKIIFLVIITSIVISGCAFDKKDALLFGLRSCDGEHTVEQEMTRNCSHEGFFQ